MPFVGVRMGLPYLGGGGSLVPSWVPNQSNPPDFAINWQTNQVWQKGVQGFVTPATFGVATTRASVKWVVDNGGNWTQFLANTTAWSNRGRLVEEGRTNLFLNSQAPVTQTITVVNASTYAVSVVGTGSLVLSGALTGTVTQGNPIIAAAGSTSLTVTTAGITGTFINAQVELGASVTSPIVTTGSSATRAADVTKMTISMGSAYTLFASGVSQTPTVYSATRTLLSLDDGTTTNRTQIAVTSTGNPNYFVAGGGTANATGGATWAGSTFAKLCASFAANSQAGSFAGGAPFTTTSAVTTTGITTLHFGSNGAGGGQANSLAVVEAVWLSQALSGATMQGLTA